MAPPFDMCFIFAEMRTGSNHLEAMLDAVPGLKGLGEVFNPSFVGREKQETLLGFDLKRREAEPQALLDAIRDESRPDLPIIRFFHDHDARILDGILADKRVAKVILTRNPIDSYISRKIAAETGQWRMTDARSRKHAEVRFIEPEFETMLAAWQGFSANLRHGLQVNGQTAFELSYDDLGDTDILNGLLRFLRISEPIDPSGSKLKPQNPGGPRAKVVNPDEMTAALARIDHFGLNRPNRAELTRSAAVKTLTVLPNSPLMLMPVPGVKRTELQGWMAALGREDPQNGLTQRDLRQWMRRHPGHVKFSVLAHPLDRAHWVFCADILPRRPMLAETRRLLRRRYDIPLPQDWPDPGYDVDAHRRAFFGFLDFLVPCLAGQTSLAPLPEWSGQLACLQGMAGFVLPDRIIRTDNLQSGLAEIAGGLGVAAPPLPGDLDKPPLSLGDIYNQEIEAKAREAYRRDYVFFGFSDWSDQAA